MSDSARTSAAPPAASPQPGAGDDASATGAEVPTPSSSGEHALRGDGGAATSGTDPADAPATDRADSTTGTADLPATDRTDSTTGPADAPATDRADSTTGPAETPAKAPSGAAAPASGAPGTGAPPQDPPPSGTPEDAPTPPAPSEARHRAVPESGPRPPSRRRRVATRVTLVVLVLLLATAAAAAVHLYRTSQAWEDRADLYEGTAGRLGEELAASRAELTGTQAELEAVRAQLETAKARIVQLADEKAQAGDDVEAQRQLVDYQERVSDAAGTVARALDQCVQGQQDLIGYLEDQAAAAEQELPPPYVAEELEQFRQDVQTLCQTATEANISLQRELQR